MTFIWWNEHPHGRRVKEKYIEDNFCICFLWRNSLVEFQVIGTVPRMLCLKICFYVAQLMVDDINE
jgi:hypothetical protein